MTIDGVKVFKLYGAAGSDEVKIDGVKTTGLDQFTIDLGQRLIQQGTTTETETIGSGDEAQTFTREIPNYIFNPDGASDSIVFVGSSLNDDFAISSSGQIEGGGYTSFDVRASGNLNYRVTIENSIRSEGDQLTLQSLAGDDRLDASTLVVNDLIAVVLEGGEGDDRLIGSPFNDILKGGTGSDTFTGGQGLDLFFDSSTDASDEDVLIESNDLDVMITDSTFITGNIVGDGLIQIVTVQDGLDKVESQRITSTLGSGSFKLTYNSQTTDDISYNAKAEKVEEALKNLSSAEDLRVSQKSSGTIHVWEVTFLGPSGAPKPGDYAISSNSANVTLAVVEESGVTKTETQRVTHSGSSGTFVLGFSNGSRTSDGNLLVEQTEPIAYNASAEDMEAKLESLTSVNIGTLSVTTYPVTRNGTDSEPYTWKIKFEESKGVRGLNVNQLVVVENNLGEYSTLRNFDFGPENRSNISCLSPYITHGIINENEVIKKSLSKFSFSKNEKFIQEVLWRTYWKGWLELRPNVWSDYLMAVSYTHLTLPTNREV